MITESPQPSTFGAKLGAWGKLALFEIKRDMLLLFLRMRSAKIKAIDRTRAHHQLGKKCHEQDAVPEQLEALRLGIQQVEQRLEAKRQQNLLPNDSATFSAKVKALLGEAGRKGQMMSLTLRRRWRLCRFGRSLAANAETGLPEKELSRVHALQQQLDDLEAQRREIRAWGFSPRVRWMAVGGVTLVIGTMLLLGAIGFGFIKFKRSHSSSHSSQETTTASANHDTAGSAPTPAANAKEAQEWLDKGEASHRAGDMVKAYSSFRHAADLGDPRAQFQVGWCYENDAGVAQDYWQAAHWYRKAAEAGNATAMKNLGQLYENGQGVSEDWVMAAQWYRKSAEKMDSSAEVAMGRAYQFGIGVPQDRQLSIYWNERASAHGDASSEHWVQWLRDPTNKIGFRNDGEQSLVMSDQPQPNGALLGADPAGLLFHKSEERLEWLRGVRNAVDKNEAQNRRHMVESERQQAESSRRKHEGEMQRLMGQGLSREAAEGKAGW